jgi:hypothetical protein
MNIPLGKSNNISIVDGQLGVCLSILEASELTQDRVKFKKALSLFKLAYLVNNSKKIFIPSLFGGGVGLIWVSQRFLSSKLLSESGKEFISKVHKSKKEQLEGSLSEYLKGEGRFELLYGGIGCSISLGLKDGAVVHGLVLDYLHENLVESDSGKFLRTAEDTSLIFSNHRKMSDSINTGISHGIGGVLLYCTYLLEKGVEVEKSKIIAEAISNTMLKISTSTDNRNIPSYFPDSAPPRQNTWCYGDMGFGLALMKYSAVNSDKDSFAHGKFRFDLGFSSYIDQAMKSSCLCHGSACVKALLEMYYELVGSRDEYKEEYRQVCTELSLNVGIQPGFISGGHGGYLSLLSRSNSIVNWESLLLLRNPWEGEE